MSDSGWDTIRELRAEYEDPSSLEYFLEPGGLGYMFKDNRDPRAAEKGQTGQ